MGIGYRVLNRFVCGAVARLLACAIVVGISACSDGPVVTPVHERPRELHIATLESATIYARGERGHYGYEHDLVKSFAHFIGATPRFIVARDESELVTLIESGKADMAAAMVPVRATPPPGLLYGPTYLTARPLIVYRRGNTKPATFADLRGKRIAATDALGLRAVLEKNLPASAGYMWPMRVALASEELLARVEDGEIDYAVMPSTDFAAAQRFYPETEVAFEFGAPAAIAWLYSADQHFDIGRPQIEFFRALRANGALAGIEARYFSAPRRFDYIQSRAFLEHYAERLPAYRSMFEATASRYGIDWLLLAALSYQESHWRKDATSPTGVRGLMMLTRNTAEALAVDRLDPHASIRGGAEYLSLLKAKLPARIAEPDRTWLALAAYNVGLARVEAARVLTDKAGGDPDSWTDVRRFLPRVVVARPARHGGHGARGWQAVKFVDSTRRYYDTLRWLEGDIARGTMAAATAPPETSAAVL